MEDPAREEEAEDEEKFDKDIAVLKAQRKHKKACESCRKDL